MDKDLDSGLPAVDAVCLLAISNGVLYFAPHDESTPLDRLGMQWQPVTSLDSVGAALAAAASE